MNNSIILLIKCKIKLYSRNYNKNTSSVQVVDGKTIYASLLILGPITVTILYMSLICLSFSCCKQVVTMGPECSAEVLSQILAADVGYTKTSMDGSV